jgi:hypothetical protein
MPADWVERAACAEFPQEIFFSESYDETGVGAAAGTKPGFARAQAICASCPVRIECFRDAMAEEEEPAFFIDAPRPSVRHGIRGGVTPQQRESIYKRQVLECEVCGESYDPMGVVAGEVVCACGWFSEAPIHPRGDQWGQRQENILLKLRTWILDNTAPGDELPSISELKDAIEDRRKDGVARFVLERLAEDGLLERRGSGHRVTYVRRAGKQVLASWVPPARRRAA